ncbi:MAG TPA: hypothetical protein VGS79_08200 [Puia sp.]|nr:hypothetical protein [Puia sp.]
MSSELDNIQLSPLLVGELYKDVLLLSPDGPPALQRPTNPAPQPAAVQPAPPPQRTPEPAPQRVAEPAPQSQPKPQKPAPAQHTPEPAPKRPQAPAPAADTPSPYKFLGKNGKKITIVVQSPTVPFLPDNQLSFLTKILEACRMNIGDVAIVNAATIPVNIATLRQQLEPAVVLLFGLEPTAIKLPINFPVFKIQPYDNCSYLAAPPLTQLVQQSEESKLLKSKLWVCLKSLFNV